MCDAFEVVYYQKLQPCLVLITLNQSILVRQIVKGRQMAESWASNFWIRKSNKKMENRNGV